MKPRFLVLIDFSSYSSGLLQFAYEWSKIIHAELVLVHQTGVFVPAMADHQSRLEITTLAYKEATDKLKEFAQNLLPHETRLSYKVTDKNIEAYLPKLLQEPYQHLVFVGLKGTGALKKIFIGSVAVKVIDNINNFIMALPLATQQISPASLFVAVSRNYPLNVIELNRFLNLMGNNIKKVNFFSILQPGDDTKGVENYLQGLNELYSGKMSTDYQLYRGEEVFQQVQNIMQKNKDGILVVQRGSRMLFDKVFRKFLINELVYTGHIPLLILP